MQHQVAGIVAGQLQSPAFLTELGLGKALLPASDPQLRHATPQSVMALTPDKLKAYYTATFRPDMTTIVVVGKVDPARYALNLGNEVLGGGFYASRLYHDLRDTRGLVYNVGTSFDLGKHRSTYSVSFGADPDKMAAASKIVVRDLKQMQRSPVTDTELIGHRR